MGGGASNLSSTDLQSYQESVSEVSQNIQNQASNLTSQQVNVDQTINLKVGTTPPPENPCATTYLESYNTCINTQCRGDIPAVYECQIKKGVVTGPTSDALCTKAFGYTYEQATDNEGYCSGNAPSTITDVQLRNICLNKLLRTTCIANDVGDYIYHTNTSCISDADCNVGTTCDLNNSTCGVRGPSGSYDKTCGGNCGTKTIYQIEYIKDSKRRFTLDQIDTPPAGVTQCQFNNIPTAEGQSCWRKYNLDDYYDCQQAINTGTVQKPNCQDICTGFLCTAEMAKIMEPPQALLDVEGSICLRNESNTTLSSNQIAEATTTAILTSVVSNQFQNEISKIINQTNSGMNFGQENNSQERTSITQKVRTTVRQALDASSKNMATKNVNNKQEINFTVESGTVRIRSACDTNDRDCVTAPKDSTPSGDCPKGGLILTNSAINQLNDSQTAKSVVNATINSNILNDIRSKYSFTLTQKNENDLLGALLGLLATYFIFILGILGLTAFIAYKFSGKFIDILKDNLKYILGFTVFLIIIWIIVGSILYGTRSKDDPNYTFGNALLFQNSTYTNTNPSGQAPQPPPADPNKPGPNEVECKIMNLADCQCSVFVQKVDGKTDDEICAPIIGQLSTPPNISISDQCGQLVQRNILWGNNKITVDYCAITTNPSEQKCSLRSYTDSQTRAICKSPASAPVSTPTASPTMAPKV